MPRLTILLAAVLLASCASEEPTPPGNDVNIVIDECTDASNEVCK